ncbi:hypothetical protein R83H12_00666 [Fibrobacteria bacterium R8-3-H12]
MLEIVTLASTLLLIAVLLYMQHKILGELKNIRIPPPQKIEIPPAKEVVLDLNPVVEAVKNICIPPPQKIEFPKIELPHIEIPKIEIPKIEIPQAKEININTETLQEIVTLMRVNQAEFQSGLDAFHKAIDKLLVQIPSGEKELNAQKEFMQKFEAAFAKVQEQATEAMNENSLRLQEILAEFLNKERGNG